MPRIIAGKARGTQLIAPPGRETRPTADRTKEALFSILAPRLPGARFLDLFAGSGQIGLEALSRGAAAAVFVENERRAVQAIRANLAKTQLAESALVLAMPVNAALKLLATQATSQAAAQTGAAQTDAAQAGAAKNDAAQADAAGAETESAADTDRLFDIIFLDPPYADAHASLARLADRLPLATDGIVILEHESNQPAPAFVTCLQLVRSCKYGTAMLSFYRIYYDQHEAST